MIKRTLQIALFVSLLPVAFSSFAQIERYVAGTHYTELPNPVNTRDASKVEVLEAFWYGCSHCFRCSNCIDLPNQSRGSAASQLGA